VGFLDRYQQLVERYNAWAVSARQHIEKLNEEALGYPLGDSSTWRDRSDLDTIVDRWPGDLSATCSALVETATSRRAIDVVRTAGALLIAGRAGGSEACRAEVEQLLDAFNQCCDAATGAETDEGAAGGLETSVESLRAQVVSFETSREGACHGE
jgi:hypothetical protein